MEKWHVALSLAIPLVMAGQAEAFTSKQKSTISVSASGVTESTSFATAVVVQGTDPDQLTGLGFGQGPNELRDSQKAIRVTVNTNVAGNRIIIYTDNLGAAAKPKACLDTAKGIDGGGLIGEGVDNCDKVVPVLWVAADGNVDHTFTSAAVGDDEIYVTDRAHVATFTTKNSTLDNMAMFRCRDGVAVANTAGNGIYPQFFGTPSLDEDLCDSPTPPKAVVSQELSKNIAVAGFGFLGTSGLVPELDPTTPATTTSVTSPFYLPLAADLRTALSSVNFSTNTLTVELVTQ